MKSKLILKSKTIYELKPKIEYMDDLLASQKFRIIRGIPRGQFGNITSTNPHLFSRYPQEVAESCPKASHVGISFRHVWSTWLGIKTVPFVLLSHLSGEEKAFGFCAQIVLWRLSDSRSGLRFKSIGSWSDISRRRRKGGGLSRVFEEIWWCLWLVSVGILMVRSVKSSNLVAESGSALTSKIPVKLEIEDQLDDEHGPLHKRSKISAPLPQVISIFYITFDVVLCAFLFGFWVWWLKISSCWMLWSLMRKEILGLIYFWREMKGFWIFRNIKLQSGVFV